MSKVSGAYPSLSRGVNQQPFEARLDGQHGQQVNMWSDPVHGLSRRRGTVAQSCQVVNVWGPPIDSMTPTQRAEVYAFYASYRTIPYTTDGLELLVHYPTIKAPPVLVDSWATNTQGIRVTRKIQGAGPGQAGAVFENAATGGFGGVDVEALVTRNIINARGIATACQVGRYMLFYPNDTPLTFGNPTDTWAADANRSVVLEVRQGIPNRKYSVSAVVDGAPYNWSYTTPSSAYSGTLDTSDIPYSDPEYTKKVNDRVNAYNSAVTQWITTAASQTRPSYIAGALFGSGLGTVIAVVGGGIALSDAGNQIGLNLSNARASTFAFTDGGSNEAVTVTELTVAEPNKLSSFHKPGKVVRIRADRGGASYYLKAVPTGPVVTTFAQVRWEETARTSQPAPQNPMIVMAVKNPKAGASRVGLNMDVNYLKGPRLLNDPTISLPDFGTRLVGDTESSPDPSFVNKQVNWMGMFQDRLVLASGSVLNFSEVGNYFNFYRTETLTVPDKDPVEVFALGAESDTIRHSVLFDRSLLLFGDNQQYSIDGRNPVTPASTTVIQSSAIEDATDCPPVAGGALVFFGKRREGSAEIFQMEVGDVADTSAFTGLGLQLSDYLPGKPVQLMYIASPSTLVVRCSGALNSLFIFKFVDQGRQRIMDSWSRFDYSTHFGLIYGMFYHEDAIYLRVQRDFLDVDGTRWGSPAAAYGVDVLERQSMLPQVSSMPYLDSIRPASDNYASDFLRPNQDFQGRYVPFMATAWSKYRINPVAGSENESTSGWLHGVQPPIVSALDFVTRFSDIPDTFTKGDAFAVTGIPFDSYVELTSPVRRDQGGQPIMQGRLTVSKLDIYYKDSGGLTADVTTTFATTQTRRALDFTGRLTGYATNAVGTLPVTTGSVSVFIGRESKEYTCLISSRNWMPMSITRVTWTGQWFMNHRFVG